MSDPNAILNVATTSSFGVWTFITALLGLIGGAIGSVLGIIQILQTRLKLKVIPKITFAGVLHVEDAGDQFNNLMKRNLPRGLTVEVINLSLFPVYISEVGFGIRGEGLRQILTETNVTLPVKLEPRQSIRITQFRTEINAEVAKKAVAYVETDCQKIVYGKSKIFTEYFNLVRKIQREQKKKTA